MSSGAKQPQGIADRTSVAAVLAWVDAHVTRLPAEEVVAGESLGRTVADDVRTAMDLPQFDRAAVDGIALRAEETVGAGSYNPIPFRLEPGGRGLAQASAVLVQAGEPLPRGADAVIPLEHVGLDEPGAGTVIEPVVAGSAVERIGSHGVRGSTLAARDQRLDARAIGLLSLAGVARVSVVRRPRVRCVLAGRNLVEAGRPLSPGSIHDANGPMLRALVERDGGILTELRRVGRDAAALRDAMASAGPDVVFVVGGSGPGSDDHAGVALSEAGELVVHGVAFRPGETAGLGHTAAGVPVFLLPGSPAACLWAYELFGGRAVRRLGGRNPELPFPSQKMTAAGKIVSEIGMVEVCPVRCTSEGRVVPIASFDEAGLAAATRADGFVIVPEGSEGYPQGACVTVYLYSEQDVSHS